MLKKLTRYCNRLTSLPCRSFDLLIVIDQCFFQLFIDDLYHFKPFDDFTEKDTRETFTIFDRIVDDLKHTAYIPEVVINIADRCYTKIFFQEYRPKIATFFI